MAKTFGPPPTRPMAIQVKSVLDRPWPWQWRAFQLPIKASFLFLGVLLFACSPSRAQTPIPLPYQGVIETIVGTAVCSDGTVPAQASGVAQCGEGVAVDANGNLYIADYSNGRVLAVNMGSAPAIIANVSIPAGYAALVAGGGTKNCSASPFQTTAVNASLCDPAALALDSSGNIYIADAGLDQVLVVNIGSDQYFNGIYVSSRNIATIAGGGSCTVSCCASSCAATSAALGNPTGVAVDSNQNVYIGDTDNSLVRKVTGGESGGQISAFAGGGSSYCTAGEEYGDGEPATSACLSAPAGIALDSASNLYIADTDHNRIRVVNNTSGSITIAGATIGAGDINTIAGGGSTSYEFPSSIAATTAALNQPQSVAVDSAGNIYIADWQNDVIGLVSSSSGLISVLAGTYGAGGYLGDGGLATSAELLNPYGVGVDNSGGANSGTVYVGDTGNYRIRAVGSETFTTTGDLNYGRFSHTASLIQVSDNPSYVLVAGGKENGFPTSSWEIYYPSTGTFPAADTGNMNDIRTCHTATVLPNGYVLVTGGYSSTDGVLDTAEVYVPGANGAPGTFHLTGTTVPYTMTVARECHTATYLPTTGQVLIAGGDNGTSVLLSAEIYTPPGTWGVGSCPYGCFAAVGSMNAARENHTATLLGNTYVLLTGGSNGSTVLLSSEIYNISSGTFVSSPPAMTAARQYHTATFFPTSGAVLIAGGTSATSGNEDLSSAEIYTPPATWGSGSYPYGSFASTGTSAPYTMTIARKYHTATLLDSGLVLIAGGASNSYAQVASSELFDPAQGTFTSAGSMSNKRALHTATVLPNGMVLVVGGATAGESASTRTAELF